MSKHEPEPKRHEPRKDDPPAKAKAAKVVDYDRRYLDNPENPRRRAEDANAPATPAPPVPYPAWRYHETDGKRVVENEEQDKALGSGWSDTPISDEQGGYPSWRYHATKDPVLVKTAAEAAELGPDWFPTLAAAAKSIK